jgi:hypothetical protein
MLGEKLGASTGKVTTRRILREGAIGTKVETTFEASGKLLGVPVSEHGTYWSVLRPDGTLYGEGQGVLMGKAGEMATWVGQGIGTFRKDGGVNFRGAVYYTTATAKWLRLNSVASVYEHNVDAKGKAKSDLWEWK